MCANLTIEYKEVKAKKAYEVEQTINDYRTILQQEHLTAIEEKKYDYATGIIYSDIFFECEKIGDYAINVTEAIKEIRDRQLKMELKIENETFSFQLLVLF